MEPLARLLAERAIEALVLDYAAALDAGDWDAVAALFVPHGRMSRPSAPDDYIEGADAILAGLRARPARASCHVVSQIRIAWVDEAAARVTSTLQLYTAAGAPPLVGAYADRVIATDAGWRFLERRGSLAFPA